MKRLIFLLILFSLLFTGVLYGQTQDAQHPAQSLSTTDPTIAVYQPYNLTQFGKDLRRWEIIAFGIFPFAMFNVTFITDMIRWNNANGMDFSEYGRRYAPWPLKSAGAVEMTSDEIGRTILIAAGVSLLVATIDLAIILVKRNNERKRMESMPSGSVTIERIPHESEDTQDTEDEL